MDEKDSQINVDLMNTLLEKLSSEKFQVELDLDYSVSPQAATITQAASGNIWPYVSTGTGTGNYNGTYTLPNTTGGYAWTTSGTGGSSWDTWNTNNIKPGTLQVKGDAEFEGDIKIKGKSIAETLDKIEQRLAILYPNEQLESKWEELKKLGDMYRALEKDIIEKEKIWETLKK